MAHDCPDCCQVCHCRGDIDDINFGESSDCMHCWARMDAEDDYEYDDEPNRDEFDPGIPKPGM